MNETDWVLLQQAFEAVIALPPDDRSGYLEAFSRSHPQLADQLRSMLAADASGETTLRDAIAADVERAFSAAQDGWIGRQLGAWTIRERLAVGGMGAVFLAERNDEAYEQVAALKLMSSQLHAPEAVARFLSERQILASLTHPNIARLLDGGATDDGVPYLVMEYVDGLPIDRYCAEQQLSIAARLRLLCKVCEAVDYAHRHLVIHRDLKPSNILVTDDGEPKLLDFGIAKPLSPASDEAELTQLGARVMTPEYASPEQVRGEPVSTATDVYALGVLLFRLITGESPYARSASTPREYEQLIVETGPRRPSAAVTGNDSAGNAGLSPDKLKRLLSGDLDNIVLMALQKEPGRRYPAPRALADDIRRYLAHEPVLARGDSAWYRLGKFLRRRAQALLVAAVTVSAVIGLTAFYTWRLADERDRAEAEAVRANEVADFLATLFENASPHATAGEIVTAADLLEQGAERIDALDAQPRVQAELMRLMAGSMTALGYHDRSIPMLHRVLAMREAEQPPDPIAISRTTNSLSEAYRQVSDFEHAERLMRRTIEIARDEFGPADSNVAYLTSRLALTISEDARTDEALPLYEAAMAMFEANGDGESSGAIDARGNYANALGRLGQYDAAIDMNRMNLELSERIDGLRAPNTIIRLNNLAGDLALAGRLDEATTLVDEAQRRAEAVWPDGYVVLAWIARIRARILLERGEFDAAIAQSRLSAEIAGNSHGENSVPYAVRLHRLGRHLLAASRFDEASSTLETAMAIARHEQGEEGAVSVAVRLTQARLALQQGRAAEAEAMVRDALAHRNRMSHLSAMRAQTALATALSLQNRHSEAAALFDETIAAQSAVEGHARPALVVNLGAATAHFRRAGQLEKAADYGARIAALTNAEPALLTWRGALALAEYGLTLRALDDVNAEPVLERARSVLVEVLGAEDRRVDW